MTAALWVAWIATVVFAVAAVAVAPWARQTWVRQRSTGHRVIVFCTDTGEIFDGLRIGEDNEYIRLVDVHVRANGVPIPGAPGEVQFYKIGRRFYLQRVYGEQTTASTLIPVPDQPAPAVA